MLRLPSAARSSRAHSIPPPSAAVPEAPGLAALPTVRPALREVGFGGDPGVILQRMRRGSVSPSSPVADGRDEELQVHPFGVPQPVPDAAGQDGGGEFDALPGAVEHQGEGALPPAPALPQLVVDDPPALAEQGAIVEPAAGAAEVARPVQDAEAADMAPAVDDGAGAAVPVPPAAPIAPIAAPIAPAAPAPALPAQNPESSAPVWRNLVEADSPAPFTGLSGMAQVGINADGLTRADTTPNATASGVAGVVSGGADLVSAALAARDLYNLPSPDPHTHDDSELRNINATRETAGANLAQSGIDLGSRTASAVSTFAHGVAPVVGTAAGAVGAGVGGLVAARTARRLWRAQGQHSAVAATLPHLAPNPAVQAAATFHQGQLNQRRWKAGIGTLGALAGGIGGALLLAGLGPVGLGLAVAGGAVAAGLGIYKAARYLWKRHKGTLSQDRNAHATALHQNAHTPEGRMVLAGMGITQSQAQGREGIALIKRKLKSD